MASAGNVIKIVSARVANRRFSKLLAEVAGGAEFVITRHGKPVARLVRVGAPAMTRKRKAAIKRMIETMARGVDLGGRRFTRDEMHER